MTNLKNAPITAPHAVTCGEDLSTGKVVAVKFDGYAFHTETGGRGFIGWAVSSDDYEIVTGAAETYPEAFWALDEAIARAEAAGQKVEAAWWKVWTE